MPTKMKEDYQRKTKVEFYPAAIVGHFNKLTSVPENPIYRFWQKDSPFTYDKLLYSFYYLQNRYKKLGKDESYFDSINYTGKRMIDSGGFQVRTIGADIKPEDVINIYERERADVGFILDIPMIGEWNEEYINKTLYNVEYMVSQKERIPNTELLNVSHGYSPKDRRNYYERFSKYNDKLDGWAVGLIKKLPPIFNAWSFMFLYENDKTLKDKRFHFLGLTGNKNLAMIYYLARKNLVKSISFDSTKYGREGMLADIRNPAYLQERTVIGRYKPYKLKSNKHCPCPICQQVTIEDMAKDVNLCIMHNLFWEIKKMDFFDNLETDEDVRNFVFQSGLFNDQTKTALDFIDYALKYGLDDAEKHFKEHFKLKKYRNNNLSEWI